MLGFFDTLYWSRQFKRHMDVKRSARMAGIPQLGVPEILVDDEEGRSGRNAAARSLNRQTTSGFPARSPTGSLNSGTLLSADDARSHHRTWTGASPDLSAFDTSYGQHPLGSPRSPDAASPGGHNHHRAGQPSAFSFDLQEVSDGGGSSTRSSRRNSVNAENVREMLDDSVWMDSIRRSATVRRGDWGRGSQGWH